MRWLVTGASGALGSYLTRALRAGSDDVVGWCGASRSLSLTPVDLCDRDSVAAAFAAARPEAVIHAAALARVDESMRNPNRARQINVDSAAQLAELCAAANARLVYISTDLVFDGTQAPYREADAVQPLSVYGRTKADGELTVLKYSRAAVARISLLYGAAINGRPGHFDRLATALKSGEPTVLFTDEWRTPLPLATAADALIALARSDVRGTLHLGGPERMSRYEMGQRLAARLGVSADRLVAGSRDDLPDAESRPRDVSLDASRWRSLFPGVPWPRFEEACA